MAITFAGKTLLQPTEKLRQLLESRFKLSDIMQATDPSWGSAGVSRYYGPPPTKMIDKVRLNTLIWPKDASRHTIFHGLVDSATLASIRTEVTDNNYAKSLIINDGIGGEISTYMYMLPPHPIAQVEGLPAHEQQLYLITLVDERFFWWRRVGSLDPLPSSWDDLFTTALYLANNTLFPDYGNVAISSAYLNPSLKWRQRERPLPLVIDAACTAINRHFVRDLLGNTYIQHWEDAKDSTDTQLVSYKPRKAMGGEFNLGDLSRVAPEALRCIFYRPDNTRYYIDRSMAATGILAFGDFTGMPGRTAQYRSETLFIDNLSQITSLAAVAAYDWYGWLLAPTDIAFAGIINYTPNAFADLIIWEHTESNVCTRVIREPFLDYPASGPEDPYETQIIKINANIRNPDGDFDGVIQMWDSITNRWVDSSERVWVKNAN